MRKSLFAIAIALSMASVPTTFAAEPVNTDAEAHMAVSRVDFAVAVMDELYAKSNLEGCFTDLAPSGRITYTHLFTDVTRDMWYAKKLCVGMMAGVLNGNRDGSFRPLSGITAAEASKILAQAYGLTYPAKNPTGAAWYDASMYALREIGALPKNMQPHQILTRADVEFILSVMRKQERYPAERVIGEKDSPLATNSASTRRYTERVSRRTLLQSK